LKASIGDEYAGFDIMPAAARVSDSELFVVSRRKDPKKSDWFALYRTVDNGLSWELEQAEVKPIGRTGNPPCLQHLRFDRRDVYLLTWVSRLRPYRLAGSASYDAGRTWSEPFSIAEVNEFDSGYVRGFINSNDEIVSVYYGGDGSETKKFIEAVVWPRSLIPGGVAAVCRS
jgi:hypothetical protein